MVFAVVARVVCRRMWHGRRLVLIDWEVPAGGWGPHAFSWENRRDLDGIPELENASWRPLSALRQPRWSVDDWMGLPTWQDWLASHDEEDVAE
mmetsp:Transcript_45878/g.110457  ORF Transcript_45878/g.110457 Transcript_45878/m.110457 type:complete len:93 (-) Transcript_45878:4545-4823(-)